MFKKKAITLFLSIMTISVCVFNNIPIKSNAENYEAKTNSNAFHNQLKTNSNADYLISLIDNEIEYEPISYAQENIEIYLFDYGAEINSSNEKVLKFYNSASAGLDGYSISENQSKPILSKTLGQDGYPYVEGFRSGDGNEGSLKYLFNRERDEDFKKGNGSLNDYSPIETNGSSYESMRFKINNYGEGTGLFTKNEDDYYIYSSSLNSAYFNQETKKFELYDYLERPSFVNETSANGINSDPGVIDVKTLNSDNAINTMWKKVRSENFLPFNLGHQDGTAITYQDSHERSGQTLIQHNGTNRSNETNLWFGMLIEFDFLMPKNGQINDQDMVFEFLGDDDVYVYIDDVLVLDLGDDHYAEYGTINFANGEVIHPGTDTLSHAKYSDYDTFNLYQKFVEANKYDENDFVDVDGNGSLDTFKEYTKHTLKFFYLERGGYYSYCGLNFNIQPIPEGSIIIEKELASNDVVSLNNEQVFIFKVEGNDIYGNRKKYCKTMSITSDDLKENINDNGILKSQIIFENLPIGYEYNVAEMIIGEYELDEIISDSENVTINNDETIVDLTDMRSAKITFKNKNIENNAFIDKKIKVNSIN